MSIKCPACFGKTKTLHTRTQMAWVARQRECEACGTRILTHESIKRIERKEQLPQGQTITTSHLSHFQFKEQTS
jgi:transcriptional regulator NrdR family protein